MNALATLCILLALGTEIPRGSGQVTVDLGGAEIELFTYKPDSFRDGPLIMVFHGVLRNADEYRDHARGMGDRFAALIVAPRFPEQRFPLESYQLGGLLRDGKVQPRADWTWPLVPRIAADVRRSEKRPDMPYYLIGHSGGGQFLIRLGAFVASGARRIVVSNPGTYIFPTREADYPLGFGGLPDDLSSDAALRNFLSQPITLYLGTDDKERDEHFNVTPAAERQGKTRWERGQNAFHAAEQLAQRRGWTFNWRLVAVPGVGHDHQAMFNSRLCAEALFGPDGKHRD